MLIKFWGFLLLSVITEVSIKKPEGFSSSTVCSMNTSNTTNL